MDTRHPFDVERIFDNMLEIRQASELTQKELGDKVGLPRHYISRYETKGTGRCKPSFDHLVMLHRVLCGLWLEHQTAVEAKRHG